MTKCVNFSSWQYTKSTLWFKKQIVIKTIIIVISIIRGNFKIPIVNVIQLWLNLNSKGLIGFVINSHGIAMFVKWVQKWLFQKLHVFESYVKSKVDLLL